MHSFDFKDSPFDSRFIRMNSPFHSGILLAQTDQIVDSKSKWALKEDERPFFCDGECGHSLKAVSDSSKLNPALGLQNWKGRV